jgi:ankyrin repeat protein
VDDVRLRLNAGDIDPNEPDEYGRTPLWWAAWYGRSEIAELLLANKNLNMNACDGNGQAPVYAAASRGHEEIVQLLIEQTERLDLHQCCRGGRDSGATLLHIAVRNGHKGVVKLLLSSNMSSKELALLLLAKDGEGDRPVDDAAILGYKRPGSGAASCSKVRQSRRKQQPVSDDA